VLDPSQPRDTFDSSLSIEQRTNIFCCFDIAAILTSFPDVADGSLHSHREREHLQLAGSLSAEQSGRETPPSPNADSE